MKKHLKWYIIIISLLILGFIFATILITGRNYKITGNITNNIANGGIAVFNGESVYARLGGKLYKFSPDFKTGSKISDDDCHFINVAGDRIYYLTEDSIYSVNKNGEDKNLVLSVRNRYIHNFYVLNSGFLTLESDYEKSFSEETESIKKEYIFYDRSAKEQKRKAINYENINQLFYCGCIYSLTKDGHLLKQALNGKAITTLLEEDKCYSRVSFCGNLIYYVKDNGQMMKMSLNGKNKTAVFNGDMIDSFLACENAIYYSVTYFIGETGTDYRSTVYKYDLNSMGTCKLIDSEGQANFADVGSFIYVNIDYMSDYGAWVISKANNEVTWIEPINGGIQRQTIE